MKGIGFVTFFAIYLSQAQTGAGGPNMTAVKTFACSFPAYATVGWATPPNVVANTQDFTFKIDTIDPKKRSARVVGTGGASLASLLSTPVGITIIEQTPLGSVNMTTVFVAGQQNRTFLAVHSRHIGDPTSPPTVSQNYGSCEAQ
jgi:hypothetical protein